MSFLKKKTTKVIALLSVLVIGFASAIIYAVAGNEPTYRVVSLAKDQNVKRGDTISVDLMLDNPSSTAYSGFSLYLNFDADALEFVDDEDTIAAMQGELGRKFPIFTAEAGETGVINVLAGRTSDTTSEGKIATFTFKVKSAEAAAGKLPITITPREMSNDNGDAIEAKGDTEGYVFVNVPVDQDSIRLVNSDITLDMAEAATSSAKLEVEYSPKETTEDLNLSFTPQDNSIVSVDDAGNITALANGSTTIDISAFGKTLSANVTVNTSIKKLTFDKTNIKLVMGSKDTETITATIEPNTTNMSKELTWESSNPSVATVNNGVVTAVGNGTTTITAKTVNNIVATANVEVYVPITNATLSDTNITLEKGSTQQLTVDVTPSYATHADKIKWSSADENVATVSDTGLVTATGGGSTKITAVVGNNEKTLEANVTVTVTLTGISVDETAMDLMPKQTHQIIVTPNESDYTGDKTISYVSSNPSVATVSDTGLIKALANGDTDITISLQGKTATIKVHVIKAINNVTISEPTVQINKNVEKALTANLDPVDPEQEYTINWTSSDNAVVKIISTEGNKVTVKGLKGGTATITGTVKYGDVTKTITSDVTVYVPVSSLTVESNSLEVIKNKTVAIKAKLTPSDATYPEITWESSDDTIATVDENGVVTGKKAGSSATITGTVRDGQSVVVTVDVVQPITSVTLDKTTNFTMNKGDTTKITATVGPDDATEDKTVTYKSSNESVATIDQDGNVVAIGNGTTTITAKAGSVTSKGVEITVVVPVESVTMDATATVIKNQTIKLVPTITPGDATDKTITWESKNPTIATVDENGVVTGKAQGDATIVATTSNGKKAECVVTVNIIPVESISLASNKMTINKGTTKLLGIFTTPDNATELEEITWESSDPSVATIDENGNIKALKPGVTTITATMGTFTTSTELTVTEVPLESIALKNNIDNINVGDVIDLEVMLNPSNTTDEVTFSYESSDDSIVKIDENGRLTALKKGKATITIKTSNGKEVSYEINVNGTDSPDTGVASITTYGLSSFVLLSGICLTLKKIKG